MRIGARSAVAVVLACAAAAGGSAPAAAQRAARPPAPARPGVWWLGGTLVAAAAVTDAALERASLAHRSPALDRLARSGDALGVGRHLIPALGAGYVAGRLARSPRVAEAALHAAAAYTLGNVAVSVGKPALGRHRPDTTGSPWRFRPLARAGAWHSLPSAHTVHAFTLAGALAEEARRPWVTAGAYGAATVVAWSRVYADEHWASDVAASAVLGAALGHLTVRRLHARPRVRRGHLRVQPRAGGAAVTLAW